MEGQQERRYPGVGWAEKAHLSCAVLGPIFRDLPAQARVASTTPSAGVTGVPRPAPRPSLCTRPRAPAAIRGPEVSPALIVIRKLRYFALYYFHWRQGLAQSPESSPAPQAADASGPPGTAASDFPARPGAVGRDARTGMPGAGSQAVPTGAARPAGVLDRFRFHG